MAGLLMTNALRLPRSLALPQRALRRGLIAGTAWGMVMGALLAAQAAWSCDVLCLSDVALTTAFSIAAGLCTIGPLAALRPPSA
jgi:Mg/Co/Ni transporter MgtE